MIRLFVGLGNPGTEYEATRHNAGFWWLDALSRELKAPLSFDKSYYGQVARTTINSQNVWLLAPQTFMNLSGKSVGALAKFFKIKPEEILVAHDELDIIPGQVKLKFGGSHAGHNGLRDIHAQMGTGDYWRLRLGVGHPGNKDEVVDWVLRKPMQEHRVAIEECITRSLKAVPALLAGEMEKATMVIHTHTPPRAPKPKPPRIEHKIDVYVNVNHEEDTRGHGAKTMQVDPVLASTQPSQANGVKSPPLFEQTLGDFFDAMVVKQPDHAALVSAHQGLRYSYLQLQRESNKLASALLSLQLVPGDRVGIWSHNNAQWLLMQLATAKVGLILVNINPAYRVSEVDYALNKVSCKALVTMARFKTSNYIGMLRELAPELDSCAAGNLASAKLPQLKTVVWIDEPKDAGSASDEPGMLRFSTLLESGDSGDERVAQIAATLRTTDAINIQFTSGTTGFPKGATLTHRNILNNGFFIGRAMQLTPADRMCIPVPLYHCFGMVLGNLACLTHGATIVYPNDGFEPLSVLQTVQDEKCTALHGVPTMFIAELDHPRFKEFDLSTLRTGIMAGSPCPTEVMKRVVDRMHLREITIAYGMTETSPVSCQSSTDTPLEKRVSTVGLVQPHIDIKIIDPESGAVVPLGERGEFCTRGYSVMQSYWGDAEKTAEAIDADGWMHTGDLAVMDAEGYVNIVGRIKDMVIRGGENIYPREIEEYLYRHAAVQDVQVVGLPDKKYGEELCAWIIVKPGQSLTEDEIRSFCVGQIAHYKVPRHIQFVTEFPMTVTGKIQKFKIRDAMKAQLGLTDEKTA